MQIISLVPREGGNVVYVPATVLHDVTCFVYATTDCWGRLDLGFLGYNLGLSSPCVFFSLEEWQLLQNVSVFSDENA